MWGAQEKKGANRATWSHISEEDLALGYRNGSIISASKVVTRIDSPQLASKVWGEYEGGPFRLMYFLSKPHLCDVPVSSVPEYLGQRYYGFARVSEEKVKRIMDDYGSFDNFIERKLIGREASMVELRYWVEKTLVKGRSDRESGLHALGKALWSPQKSTNDRDYYHNMLEVKPGDIVFHFIDNRLIAGVSVVTSGADDHFVGLTGTPWADRPAYRIEVSDFVELDPAIEREEFLKASEHRGQLQEILAKHKSLFFNKKFELNQGAYLTKAPTELVNLWNHIYRAKAGVNLPHVSDSSITERILLDSFDIIKDLSAIHASFSSALKASHISFGPQHENLVRAFVASLATKRFVILTGLSGSGKTQIGVKFGEWLGKDKFQVIPVRPDWTGSEALFGYEDALQPSSEDGRRAWHVPDVLRFMLTAARDPQNPYLIVLDEMNLAHVERYFADVLSGMESMQPCLPNLEEEEDGYWRCAPGQSNKILYPYNLFVVGTVNVDETTYMFSPKVLDRANTLDFRVDTKDLSPEIRKPIPCETGNQALVRGFLAIAKDESWHFENPATNIEIFVGHFLKLHRLLAEGGFEFGHRVFYEAVRFAAMHEAAGDKDPVSSLDLQVMQKVLPRLHGSRRRLEPTLCSLGRFCFDLKLEADAELTELGSRFDPLKPPPGEPILPKSFAKVSRMMRILRVNQFTSFTE